MQMEQPQARVSTEKGFKDWLSASQPGDRVIYHTGIHADGPASKAARVFADTGIVHLVQRRCGNESAFDYIAQKAGKRRVEK